MLFLRQIKIVASVAINRCGNKAQIDALFYPNKIE